MSFWTEKWAYEQEPETSGAKFVLVCVAHHATEDGYCYPSQRRLAAMTGLKERAVRGHLAALEKTGFIERTERRSESGYRTSDGIKLCMREEDLRLPAEIAASEVSPAKNDSLTGKKRQSHRQKLPDYIENEVVSEPSVNEREVKALSQLKRWTKSKHETDALITALREKYPKADFGEGLDAFIFVVEYGGKTVKNLPLTLRTYIRKSHEWSSERSSNVHHLRQRGATAMSGHRAAKAVGADEVDFNDF